MLMVIVIGLGAGNRVCSKVSKTNIFKKIYNHLKKIYNKEIQNRYTKKILQKDIYIYIY